jgi:hypothetical protein
MYVAKISHVIAQASQNHSLLAALELNSLTVVYIKRLLPVVKSSVKYLHKHFKALTKTKSINLHHTNSFLNFNLSLD